MGHAKILLALTNVLIEQKLCQLSNISALSKTTTFLRVTATDLNLGLLGLNATGLC